MPFSNVVQTCEAAPLPNALTGYKHNGASPATAPEVEELLDDEELLDEEELEDELLDELLELEELLDDELELLEDVLADELELLLEVVLLDDEFGFSELSPPPQAAINEANNTVIANLLKAVFRAKPIFMLSESCQLG